jgi:hypothetical protein
MTIVIKDMLTALMLFGALQPNLEVGQNLTPPAQIAGPWEALVVPGEVAGFSLQVITNADEKVRLVRVDTYIRKDDKTTRTWWSSGDAGAFVLRTGQLRFHQVRSANGGFDVTLDLTYDANDMAWKGSFSDPFFSGQVVLRRPSLSDAIVPAGTWRTYSNVVIAPTGRVVEYGCLNMGVGQDDALVLWAEFHNIFLGHDKAKQDLYGDSYGSLYDDSHAMREGNEWSLTSGTGMSGDRITGVISSDGSAFGGFSGDHYGNGPVDLSHRPHPFAWKRMLDLACRP